MPYVVARLFSGSSDQSPEQLDRIARQELVPQLLQIPGLLRYSTLQFNDGRVGAFSVYENREAAERGLRVASEWVSSTEAVRNYRLDETLRGEVVYTVVGQGNQLQRNAYGVARIYETIARAEDIARALQEEAAEIISASTPGLIRYSLVRLDDGRVERSAPSGIRKARGKSLSAHGSCATRPDRNCVYISQPTRNSMRASFLEPTRRDRLVAKITRRRRP